MSLENELKTARCALEEATAANKAMAAQLVTAMDRLSEQLNAAQVAAPATATATGTPAPATPVPEVKKKTTKKKVAKKKVAKKMKKVAEDVTGETVKAKLTEVLRLGSIQAVTSKLAEIMGSGVNYQELEPNDERLVALDKFADDLLAG